MENDNYSSQKRYLAKQKQLRVWVSQEKYETFKEALEAEGKSIYSAINDYIDEYIKTHPKAGE